MAASEAVPNSWEALLRKMLPEGAPLPDEDQLDYSISVDYIGPSPFFKFPINPMIPKTKFTTFPKEAPSLTPCRKPSSWLHSHSSSVAFNDASYSELEIATASDHNDHVQKLEIKHSDCATKGRCSRCGERNGLLKGREGCIVCGAEYCKSCVLKAMGSMPEGRKCLGCIGEPIDEANRRRLGKGSRFLSRLCSRSEFRRIMEVERECRANRVRAEKVIVNGRELREEELDELLGCNAPPTDLKPGRYWYDKESGFWGKEGQKPDRIISSKMDVGGKLQADASNGDTRVYLNGREITKVELRMLKLAKVQCPRDTCFWLYEDGSYEEEGQNSIRGNIWKKASVRFICSLLSLAVPPERAHCTKEGRSPFSARLFPEYLEQRRVQKLLLLGLEGSETSTIFKQAKLIYTNKFTHEELQNIKLIIIRNMYRYLGIILEGREHFEEEALIKGEPMAADRSVQDQTKCDGSGQCMYSPNEKINHFSHWLMNFMAAGDLDASFSTAAHEYAPIVDEIWKDSAVQETYKRIEELQFLPDVAKYFLDRAVDISSNEYEPSDKDILFAEGVTPTNGVACIEFSLDDHSAVSQIFNQHLKRRQLLTKYQLILLSSPRLNDGCKWLDMFEGTSAVIFCFSLSDYNIQFQNHSKGDQQNKMLANRDLFERVARRSCFDGTPFVLLLTKYDVFEDKLERVPLTVCEWFGDFNPLKTHGKSSVALAHHAFHYIALKFKELYGSITGRKLYVRLVIGDERESVDDAFRSAREILDWEEQKAEGFCAVSDEDTVSDSSFQ